MLSNSDLEVSRLDYTQDHVLLYTLTIFVILVVEPVISLLSRNQEPRNKNISYRARAKQTEHGGKDTLICVIRKSCTFDEDGSKSHVSCDLDDVCDCPARLFVTKIFRISPNDLELPRSDEN